MLNLTRYNTNPSIANCELDNIELTSEFARIMYEGILPRWDAQITICSGRTVKDISYVTPENGYINVSMQGLDEKCAFNMWINGRQVLGTENPTTYYRGTTNPLFRVKKGVTVKITGGNTSSTTQVDFIPLRKRISV